MPTQRFDEIPADALALIEANTGPLLKAEPVTSGLNSEIAARIHTADGIVFVKGLGRDHPRVWTQAREAAINPYVQGLAPGLLWRVQEGSWDLLGFEDVDGRHADYSRGSQDLPMATDAIAALARIPAPDTGLRPMTDRMAAYVQDPSELAWLEGDRLLHTDWNPHNVLITDRARIVDWAWASRGAGWIDPALWVIWLIAEGAHSPAEAEAQAASLPTFASAPTEGLDVFARATAAVWQEIAGDDPDPWVVPRLRAAHAWARHRRVMPAS